MTTYQGKRTANIPHVEKISDDNTFTELDPCFEYVNHSPDGFEWGYEGSGPAQLAFAIVFDHLCFNMKFTTEDAKRETFRLYQDFKRRVVAHLGDQWRLTKEKVQAELERIHVAQSKQYIGDSVYIQKDHNQYILTTENGLATDPSNRIFLEPFVADALIEYIRADREKGKSNER